MFQNQAVKSAFWFLVRFYMSGLLNIYQSSL